MLFWASEGHPFWHQKSIPNLGFSKTPPCIHFFMILCWFYAKTVDLGTPWKSSGHQNGAQIDQGAPQCSSKTSVVLPNTCFKGIQIQILENIWFGGYCSSILASVWQDYIEKLHDMVGICQEPAGQPLLNAPSAHTSAPQGPITRTIFWDPSDSRGFPKATLSHTCRKYQMNGLHLGVAESVRTPPETPWPHLK